MAVQDRKSPSQDKTLVGHVLHPAFGKLHDRRELKLGNVEQLGGLDPHIAHPALVVVTVLPDQASFGESLPNIVEELADHLELVGRVPFTGVFLKAGKGVEVDRVAVEQDRIDAAFLKVLQGAGERGVIMKRNMDVGEHSDPFGSLDHEGNEFAFITGRQRHRIVRLLLGAKKFLGGNFPIFSMSPSQTANGTADSIQ